MGPNHEHREWQDLEYVETPDESDYREAIKTGIANNDEKRRYLRMRIWWCGNDAIREGAGESLSEEHLDNLQEFAKLLSEDEADGRLMKAEVYRELGMFEESKRLLEFDFPEEMAAALNCIHANVERGENRVMEVTCGEQ